MGNVGVDVGRWIKGQKVNKNSRTDIGTVNSIRKWAINIGVDAVVWTALEVGLSDHRGVIPAPDEVLSHLHGLPYVAGRAAERYIRRTPIQIDTNYRRMIQQELGWTPIDE